MNEEQENEMKAGVGDGVEKVEVISGSASKLEAGLATVEERAKEASEQWEKKLEEAGISIMCNSCGKKFASVQGVKKHWSAKSSKCSEKKGYKEVHDVVPGASDRSLHKEGDGVAPLDIAAEATKEIREARKESSLTNGRKITVVDLVRCPTPMLEGMLKKAEDSEIKKFVSMRFHPANASRKFIAEKELSRRK